VAADETRLKSPALAWFQMSNEKNLVVWLIQVTRPKLSTHQFGDENEPLKEHYFMEFLHVHFDPQPFERPPDVGYTHENSHQQNANTE